MEKELQEASDFQQYDLSSKVEKAHETKINMTWTRLYIINRIESLSLCRVYRRHAVCGEVGAEGEGSHQYRGLVEPYR